MAGAAQKMLFSLNPWVKKSIGVNSPVPLLPLDGLVEQGRIKILAVVSKIAKLGTLDLPGWSSGEDTMDTAAANMIRKWD